MASSTKGKKSTKTPKKLTKKNAPLNNKLLVFVIVALVAVIGAVVVYTSSAATACYNQTIKLGNKNQCNVNVSYLVRFHFWGDNKREYPNKGGVPSTYNQDEKNLIIVFQNSKGLTKDGIVGRNTWKALCTPKYKYAYPYKEDNFTKHAYAAGCPKSLWMK